MAATYAGEQVGCGNMDVAFTSRFVRDLEQCVQTDESESNYSEDLKS